MNHYKKNKLKKRIAYITFAFLSMIFLAISIADAQTPAKKTALLIKIDGAIGPAIQDFVVRGIKDAQTKHAELVILQIDTPGGLDKSMRGIIKAILGSSVPVVTYVAPSGARAASAGTYIMYASHFAAMAPGTNLGAATPVAIGGFPGTTPEKDDKKDKDKKTPSSQEAMSEKAKQDAKAYIKSLAQLRNRNTEWAQLAVEKASSLSAKDALKMNVINLMANNIPDLLKQLNGKTIEIKGKQITLNTENIAIEQYHPDWRMKFLSVITDPSVAYILMIIGFYGLIFEFINPGFIVPGVVGAICLLLALYAFQLLPINYAGFALIVLGIAFMVAEAFMPSFGILGIGGIIAFIAGSILLMDTDVPGFNIAWPVIIGAGAATGGFFIVVMGLALRARRRKVVTGSEGLIDLQGIALEDFTDEGHVRVQGELWQAKTNEDIKKNDKISVTKVEGLVLVVKKI